MPPPSSPPPSAPPPPGQPATPEDRRVALVTGGTRGIGLGIARALARAGFDLALNGRRPAEEVAGALADVAALGAAAHYAPGDIADAHGRTAVLASVRDHFGRLDTLVNNAGIAPAVRADLLDATEESFDHLLATNLRGPHFLTQSVARWMRAQRAARPAFRGTIVFVTSISATVASTNRGDYCISKAGLSMAARLWATRLAAEGIAVHEVRPGIIATDMTAAVKEKYDALLASGLALEPRWGTPDDVGAAVAALARGDLTYAPGQVLVVDGGLTLPRL